MGSKQTQRDSRLSSSGPKNKNNEESVSTALSSIRDDISDIKSKLTKLDAIDQVLKDTKEDIWGSEGLDGAIKCVAELSEYNESDIKELREENCHLRREIDLMKALMIRMDRKIENQGREITELKNRSMRDNIMIYNFEENSAENLMESVPREIKCHLGIDVEFIRIHRNSPTPNVNGKPRSITGKLVDRQKKFDLLAAQGMKRKAGTKLPFIISPQSPPEMVEEHQKLRLISSKYRENGIRTRLRGNKLVFEDGTIHRDKVNTPRAEDLLLTDERETERLEKITLKTNKSTVVEGNKFKGNCRKAHSINDVRDTYKKVVRDKDYARADHNVLVYRIGDEEGFCDDGEFGSLKRILKHLRDRKIDNIALVISRWYSGQQLGPRRFEIMTGIADQVVGNL